MKVREYLAQSTSFDTNGIHVLRREPTGEPGLWLLRDQDGLWLCDARLTVRLNDDDDVDDRVAELPQSGQPGVATRPTILVVDDAPDTRELLTIMLSGAGFEVASAENGHAALRVLAETGLRPALFLLDLAMPEMDGWDLVKALFHHPEYSHVPIIVMTGHATLAPLLSTTTITKPFTQEALLGLIGKVLAG